MNFLDRYLLPDPSHIRKCLPVIDWSFFDDDIHLVWEKSINKRAVLADRISQDVLFWWIWAELMTASDKVSRYPHLNIDLYRLLRMSDIHTRKMIHEFVKNCKVWYDVWTWTWETLFEWWYYFKRNITVNKMRKIPLVCIDTAPWCLETAHEKLSKLSILFDVSTYRWEASDIIKNPQAGKLITKINVFTNYWSWEELKKGIHDDVWLLVPWDMYIPTFFSLHPCGIEPNETNTVDVNPYIALTSIFEAYWAPGLTEYIQTHMSESRRYNNMIKKTDNLREVTIWKEYEITLRENPREFNFELYRVRNNPDIDDGYLWNFSYGFDNHDESLPLSVDLYNTLLSSFYTNSSNVDWLCGAVANDVWCDQSDLRLWSEIIDIPNHSKTLYQYISNKREWSSYEILTRGREEWDADLFSSTRIEQHLVEKYVFWYQWEYAPRIVWYLTWAYNFAPIIVVE